MKKITVIIGFIICLTLTACNEQNTTDNNQENSSTTTTTTQSYVVPENTNAFDFMAVDANISEENGESFLVTNITNNSTAPVYGTLVATLWGDSNEINDNPVVVGVRAGDRVEVSLPADGLLPQQSTEIKTKLSASTSPPYEIEFLNENQEGLSFSKEGNRKSSSKKREITNDGIVGDNNGDGNIDEDDWETEWKDYLDKKYDEAGL